MKVKKTISRFKNYVVPTVITALLLFVVIGIVLFFRGLSGSEMIEAMQRSIVFLIKKPIFWLAASIPSLLISIIKFNIRQYRKGKLPLLARSLTFSTILPIVIIALLFTFVRWYTTSGISNYQPYTFNSQQASKQHLNQDGKYRGIHVFGIRNITDSLLQTLNSANFKQIIVVPYAYQEDIDTPEIRYSPLNEQELNKRDSAIIKLYQKAQILGINIIVKPHIWITNPSDGKWRGDLAMNSEQEWLAWENSYRSFILHNAYVSELIHAPIFCIGNEFYESTTKRPTFWKKLITEVRSIYSGKITYGANWDREFAEIQFWDQLDYIGIQAYYPLSKTDEPTTNEIISGWKKHLKAIEKISNNYNRPVIFTEIGYKSTVNAASAPWEWESMAFDMFRKISWQTQSNCYEAFFKTVWIKPWFKGAWLWQWQARGSGDPKNRTFSIHNKPAFEVVSKGFANQY